MFWGAFDFEHADESPYSSGEIKDRGTDANSPGIGVRRASLRFSRLTIPQAQDAVVTHLDFLNITAGDPDDTWVDADFTTLEGYITTWWSSIKDRSTSRIVLDQIRWYRIGPGIVPPNPAVRITETNTAGTQADSVAPQIALTCTLRTVPRRQWGRMYLPVDGKIELTTDGYATTACVDDIAGATNTLFSSAASSDFLPVIYSPTRGKAYSVEKIQVDNLFDVQRSRRFSAPTYRKTYP